MIAETNGSRSTEHYYSDERVGVLRSEAVHLLARLEAWETLPKAELPFADLFEEGRKILRLRAESNKLGISETGAATTQEAERAALLVQWENIALRIQELVGTSVSQFAEIVNPYAIYLQAIEQPATDSLTAAAEFFRRLAQD